MSAPDVVVIGGGNAALCAAIRQSEAYLPWMEAHGVRFQPSPSGTLSLARTNAFFLGGGKGLVNAYYRTAEALGVKVAYEAAAGASGGDVWISFVLCRDQRGDGDALRL